MHHPLQDSPIRKQLVSIAREWQLQFGVAPAIVSALSEYDAAMLIEMPETEYSASMKNATAVRRGFDFVYEDTEYQVKANRPSGRPGSRVTKVGNPKNDNWSVLIWILYDCDYNLLEAWRWSRADFRIKYLQGQRLSPDHIRQSPGVRVFPTTS